MRVACVQSDVVYGNPAANSRVALDHLTRLSAGSVDLAIFPEAYLTGYCAGTRAELAEIAIESTCSELEQIRLACDSLGIMAVLGFAEKHEDTFYNSAVLFEPSTPPRFYRKTHLPFLGMDRFVCAGDALPVFETHKGRIGILICFDMRPPEAARVLALKGADLIVVPTNWPIGAETSAEHIVIARAAENRVYLASCNRVGNEKGFEFIGRSKIVSVTGKVLASAGPTEETLIADLDLSIARQKRTVNIPGEYEIEIFACRNPLLYTEIG